jgi:hypothetical protein
VVVEEIQEVIQVFQQVLFQLLLLAVKKCQVVQAVVQDKLIIVRVLTILVQVIIHQLVRLKEILEEEVLGQLPHQVQVIHLVVAVVVEQLLQVEMHQVMM